MHQNLDICESHLVWVIPSSLFNKHHSLRLRRNQSSRLLIEIGTNVSSSIAVD